MSHTVRGVCPLDCLDSCAWEIDVDDGAAVRMRGRKDHPFTRGALCGKVNRYLDALYAPDRLTTPLRRVGAKGEGRFQPIDWDEAIGLTADALRSAIEQDGPESVMPYFYAGTIGKVQGWSLGTRLFAHLGGTEMVPTLCTAAADAAIASTTGLAVGPDPEDLVHARLILVWGSNLVDTTLHQWHFVNAARKAGAHIVCIDPLPTETASRCDEHLQLLPGTDAALAMGLMRVVLDEGGVDEDWLARHAEGWPELRDRLAAWPVSRAAEICDLPVGDIVRLGRRMATTRPTAVRIGLGLQRHGGAGAALRTIMALSAIAGDFAHVGGGSLCMTTGHFAGITSDLERPADLPTPSRRSINMAHLGDALTDPTLDPPIRAVVVWDSNPGATLPDQQTVHAGLARPDLHLTVLEHRMTDTAVFADVVLPATMQPEHLDIHQSYGHRYVALNEPAVAPPGSCLPNTEIFRRLAAALGLDHPRLHDSDEDLARQFLDTDAARERGITLESLRATGFARVDDQRGVASYAEGGFPTATGRFRIVAPELADLGIDPVPGYTPSYEGGDSDLAARYPLILLTPATRFFMSSTFGDIPFHRSLSGGPIVFLHPDDASGRAITEGDLIEVGNDRGSFIATAAVHPLARRGVAWSYKAQWARTSPGGSNVNATTPRRDADMGGAPTFQDNRVEARLYRTTAEEPSAEALVMAAQGGSTPDARDAR